MVVAEATDAERDEVLIHTHALWGGKRTVAGFQQFTRELLALPWAQSHYRFVVGRDGAGRIVSACKVYDLDMWAAGRVVPGIGFGAVFTLPEFRRQGHAGAMLAEIMRERGAAGAVLATLMSDIDPAYYERLGFVRLPSREARAPLGALGEASPARLRPARPEEWPQIVAMSRERARRCTLAYYRQPDHLPYMVAWRSIPDVLLLESAGRPAGFLVGKPSGTYYQIAEGGIADPADTAGWLGAIRAHAEASGAGEAGGWLPEADPALREAFSWKDREDGIWMAARLRPEAPDVAGLASGSHCFELDHF